MLTLWLNKHLPPKNNGKKYVNSFFFKHYQHLDRPTKNKKKKKKKKIVLFISREKYVKMLAYWVNWEKLTLLQICKNAHIQHLNIYNDKMKMLLNLSNLFWQKF